MEESLPTLFVHVYLKLFFVLTPFFAMSSFLSLTAQEDDRTRRKLALKVTVAVLVIAFLLYFFGRQIFAVFGITLNAFRIGAGVLLLLSAVNLVQGRAEKPPAAGAEDVAVVPLAIPVIVGPATTGVLLVMGAEAEALAVRVVNLAALGAAVVTVGLLLYAAVRVERWIGETGLRILSKLTGLVLASLAAQIIFTGLRHFLRAE